MTNAVIESLGFPSLRSSHRGQWFPLYLEPLVGSGERFCIGVLATDGIATEAVAVPSLSRLSEIYGAASRSLGWAAELALRETRYHLEQHGIESIQGTRPPVDGLTFGKIRQGAGENLANLARVALLQVSSLAALEGSESEFASHAQHDASIAYAVDANQTRVLSSVKKIVTSIRPELKEYFGLSVAPSQSARPLVIGFVGKRIAVNFAALTAATAAGLSGQVDRAKARVLDLEWLRTGKLGDQLPIPRRKIKCELLVLRHNAGRKGDDGKMLREAERSLEAQADEFKIDWRPFKNTNAMAHALIDREVAGFAR